MQTIQSCWKFLWQHSMTSLVVKASIVGGFGLLFLGTTLAGVEIDFPALTSSGCSGHDEIYTVAAGDTPDSIAERYSLSWNMLASYNRIATAGIIYTHQKLCIPTSGLAFAESLWGRRPAIGYRNAFPYGSCTWWANQRYHQLHGVYVPWGSNAWQWTAQAYRFGWRVSRLPKRGAIIDLQPWVQGAYGYGHVAVVERILRNGRVLASSMNWGWRPWAVTYFYFHPGPGVTFISQ